MYGKNRLIRQDPFANASMKYSLAAVVRRPSAARNQLLGSNRRTDLPFAYCGKTIQSLQVNSSATIAISSPQKSSFCAHQVRALWS